MNPESQLPSQPKYTKEEALEIQKEVFMTSRGMKVGQSRAEYLAESEEIWNRMHPKPETVVPVDNKESDDLHNQVVESQGVKDEEALVKVRQELGLDIPQNPPVNYIEVVVDDDYMQKNLIPNNGLRMQGGQANWKGEVDLMRYVISEDLSPKYRQIAIEKIEKQKIGQEKIYKHESHHIKNRENGLTPHLAAKNLREYLAFRVLDEMSAFTTGELYYQDMTVENIIQALRKAEQNITDSYYGQSFSNDANWYMSQHGNKPEALSRKIDQEMYHKIMRQYFKINGQDVLSILQKNNKISDFSEITNSLIIKLDSILDKMKSSSK